MKNFIKRCFPAVLIMLFFAFPAIPNAVDSYRTVILGGTPLGLKMITEGTVITAVADISPAKSAGLKAGDVIVSVNGTAFPDCKSICRAVDGSEGKTVSFGIKRGEKTFSLKFSPEKRGDGYFIGVWLKDSQAGIGTMTFYDPASGILAGLGHAVSDPDAKIILPLKSGETMNVSVMGAIKAAPGITGELIGSFSSFEGTGKLLLNSERGVYAKMFSSPTGKTVSVAPVSDVKPGHATVITTVSPDGPREFDIIIEKVDQRKSTKNMVIRITDPELLSVTGGIVPGMSGSPILQNGKLAGAITHVFVNEPARGYAIFAENMFKNIAELSDIPAKSA